MGSVYSKSAAWGCPRARATWGVSRARRVERSHRPCTAGPVEYPTDQRSLCLEVFDSSVSEHAGNARNTDNNAQSSGGACLRAHLGKRSKDRNNACGAAALAVTWRDRGERLVVIMSNRCRRCAAAPSVHLIHRYRALNKPSLLLAAQSIQATTHRSSACEWSSTWTIRGIS